MGKSVLTGLAHQQVFLKPGQLQPSQAVHRILLQHLVSGMTIVGELHGCTILSEDHYRLSGISLQLLSLKGT